LKLILIAVVTAGALAPAVAVAQAPAEGGVGIRLVEVPTASKDDPRANQYIVDSVTPGTDVRRRIEVSNGSAQPIVPRLYLGGAAIKDGVFVPSDDPAAEVVEWGAVTPREVSLAPGEKKEAVVSIHVPTDVVAGERYGAIWAELPAVQSGTAGIAAVNRVGVRVYLDVRPGGEPPTSFRLDSFAPSLGDDGRPGVDIAACNDGQRAIDLSGSLSLTEGPGGVSAGPFAHEGPAVTIAPGQCAVVPIRLSADLPRGPWKATVTLRSGKVERAATAGITFPTERGTASPPVRAKPKDVTGTTGGRLLLLLALLLLLLVLALLLWWLWRRRKREGGGTDDLTTGPGGPARALR
jgi:hypothetical protein